MDNTIGYSKKDLQLMSRRLPIGYLQDRFDKAIAVDNPDPDNEDMAIYRYTPEIEEYFRATYDKYIPSSMWDEHFEEIDMMNGSNVKVIMPRTTTDNTVRVPKVISGCCDRADQY